MLREDAAQRTPYSLRNDKGTVTYDPEEVAKIFHAFFSSLYSLPDTLADNVQQCQALLQDFFYFICIT